MSDFTRRRRSASGVLALGLAAVLAGCGSKSEDAIVITASDTVCEVADTRLSVGKTTFIVANVGEQITEVSVRGTDDRVITERENIGPGTEATFESDLTAGDYEIACKPGQKGDGIRQAITVIGEGGAATRSRPGG